MSSRKRLYSRQILQPNQSVLDLKINVFLPERFLAHPEPDSLGRAGGKALGVHLELSSGGSHTLRRDFVFFYHCLFSAQRYRNSVSLSRCPGIWKFPSSPSFMAFPAEALSLQGTMKALNWPGHSLGPQIMLLIFSYGCILSPQLGIGFWRHLAFGFCL